MTSGVVGRVDPAPAELTTAPPSRPAWRLLIALSLIKVIAHGYQHPAYGYFRDELYYIDCAKHLDWGYVDHPPFSIALLALTRLVTGDSLWIRLPAVLAGGATVLLSGLIAWRMGGGRAAQGLTAIAVLAAPILLGVDSYYSMNVFDRLFWTVLFYLLVCVITTRNASYWLGFGVVAGLGIQNKISVAFLGAAVVVGLLLTEHRRFFLRKELWLGGAIAALIVLPHALWQVWHDFPTRVFIENAVRHKMVQKSFADFVSQQLIEMHPLNAPLWIAGLGFALVGAGARFRILGVVFLVVFALFGFQGAKAYYLTPAYPPLLALGAVLFERRTSTRPWIVPSYGAVLLASGAVFSTLALPVVSPATNQRIAQAIGLAPKPEEVGHRGATLSQHLSDRIGWEELASFVGDAFDGLSVEDRRRCAILCGNYGEAGALNLYGAARGLPRAICGHNNHHLWGPGTADGGVMLVYHRGADPQRLEALFASVEPVGRFTFPNVMPEQQDRTLYLCRGLRKPMDEFFKTLRNFN